MKRYRDRTEAGRQTSDEEVHEALRARTGM